MPFRNARGVLAIGFDVGRKGMKDEAIIPFLHELRDTTFFTRDLGFYDRKLPLKPMLL